MSKIGKFDTDTAALKKRIMAHEQFGKEDLNRWIFETVGIDGTGRVLDLGCGTGKQSLALAKLGLDVTSVDVSQESLNILVRDAGENLPTTICCGIDDFGEHVSGEFDFIISSYALYYCREPIKVFDSVKKHLKKGGKFFFCGPSRENNKEVKEFLNKIGKSFGAGAAPFMEEVGPELARENFGRVTLYDFENPLTFNSAQALWEYWSSHNMFEPEIEVRFRSTSEEIISANGFFRTVKRVRGVLAESL